MTKTVLVTGGNRGIGLAIAKGLIANDRRVIIGARDLASGMEAAETIGAEAVELDVSDRQSIQRCAEYIGPVDILVNNAGVLYDRRVLQNPGDFDVSMATMVHGPFYLIQQFEDHMRKNNFGSIVNMSSEWGSFSEGLLGPNAYGIAKAALNAMTKALSAQLPNNVKINSACPGWVRTGMGGFTAPRSPEEGADTPIWLATLPDDGPTGGFFRDREPLGW